MTRFQSNFIAHWKHYKLGSCCERSVKLGLTSLCCPCIALGRINESIGRKGWPYCCLYILQPLFCGIWAITDTRFKVWLISMIQNFHICSVYDAIWNSRRGANEKLLPCLLVLWLCSGSGPEFFINDVILMTQSLWLIGKLGKMLQEIEFHKHKVHKYAADSPQIKITSSETWLAVQYCCHLIGCNILDLLINASFLFIFEGSWRVLTILKILRVFRPSISLQ